MPIMPRKRKASQQIASSAKQPRIEQFEVESTLGSGEESVKEPVSEKQKGPAPVNSLSKVTKASSRQKQAAKSKLAARKSANSKSKASSKDNDSNDATSEVESYQDARPVPGDSDEAGVRITNTVSNCSIEVSGTAQCIQNDTTNSADIDAQGMTTGTPDKNHKAPTPRQTNARNGPRAQVANMGQILKLPLPETIEMTDRDLQASVMATSASEATVSRAATSGTSASAAEASQADTPRITASESNVLKANASETNVSTADALQANINNPQENPKPPTTMEVEYMQQQLPDVDHTIFCGYGLEWNRILQSREILLKEKIDINIRPENEVDWYHVSDCPLSTTGKEAMKGSASQPNPKQLQHRSYNEKLKQCAKLPNLQPELVRADLYHLIIPRLIRHIDVAYARPGIEDADWKSLRSAAELLATLKELCYTAVSLEVPEDSGLETAVDEALEQIKAFADEISGILEQRALKLKEHQLALEQQEERQEKQRLADTRQREEEAQRKQGTLNRHEREKRYRALLLAKYAANKQRSEMYWTQELPASDVILGEIASTEDIDNRLWRRKVSGRTPTFKSFVWTPALTDILTNELIKHQDHDAEYRYEQCLKCEALSSLTVSEIRRRALEIKPFLEEEWLRMTNSIPRYVWTIK